MHVRNKNEHGCFYFLKIKVGTENYILKMSFKPGMLLKLVLAVGGVASRTKESKSKSALLLVLPTDKTLPGFKCDFSHWPRQIRQKL